MDGSSIVKTYTEVETGKRADRPQLKAALAHARRLGATLVIAKLDRLARNVYFVSGLMESNVEFVCCDNPHANRLTIHILAAVAEDEARRISDRTKAALGAYKARGGLLGASRPECRHNLSAEGRAKGNGNAAIANRRKALEAYADLTPTMRAWKDEGLTLYTIATRLNKEGHTTRTGKVWSATQVMRVLKRI
jgi:DNA invertase Pin-like site-specific DNA recombinase